MHLNNYIHRDLKPENILIDGKVLKICDFGWASHVRDTEWLVVSGGTYAYMSPESLMGKKQGAESDIWALGVLLYELFLAKEPFSGQTSEDQLKIIKNTSLDLDDAKIPISAKILISSLLKNKQEERLTLNQILKHPFLKENFFYQEKHISMSIKSCFLPFKKRFNFNNSQRTLDTSVKSNFDKFLREGKSTHHSLIKTQRKNDYQALTEPNETKRHSKNSLFIKSFVCQDKKPKNLKIIKSEVIPKKRSDFEFNLSQNIKALK